MTNEDIIKLVREVADKDKVDPVHNDMVTLTIEELGKLLAAEREACAKVCEDLPADELITRTEATVWDMATLDCAFAIRERGAP